jgi:hypothetical protein
VSFSITTAYRLVNRWRNAVSHIRSHLIQSKPPPHQKNLSQDSDNVLLKTLHHLAEVYPKAICCITEFQQQHQVPFFLK